MKKEFFGDAAKKRGWMLWLLLFCMTINVLIRQDLVGAILFIGALFGYLFSESFIDKEKEIDFYRRINAVNDNLDKVSLEVVELEKDRAFFSKKLEEIFRTFETLKEQQKTVQKQSEDTKKIVADNNLANVFVPRAKRRDGLV